MRLPIYEQFREFPLPPGVKPTGESLLFVVPEPWHTTDWSVDLGLLVRVLRGWGIRSGVVCTEVVGEAVDYPTYAVSAEEMARANFWRAWNLSGAMTFNWLLRGEKLLAALSEAGVFVIQKADSDGLEGMRVHPAAQFRRQWSLSRTPTGRLRGVWMLLKKYIYTHRKEDAVFGRNLRHARITTIEAQTSRQELLRYIRWAKWGLESRVHVLPSPVAPRFVTGPVCGDKQDAVVAIGRWDDPQKDAPLLSRALARYAARCPSTKVTLIGKGGEDVFGPLAARFGQIRYIGRVPHEEILVHLREARCILFASRWEGSPVAANEALTQGCSIAGPNIPGLHSIAADGCGTVASTRTAAALADALFAERQAWESGARVPAEIAARWRERFAPETIANRLIQWVREERGQPSPS